MIHPKPSILTRQPHSCHTARHKYGSKYDENIKRKKKLKRFQYSPEEVDQALRAIGNGMSVLKASKDFQVPRKTLRNKLSGKYPIESPRHCGPDSILGKENEKLLVDWLVNCARMGFPINKEGLLHSVKKLVKSNMKTPFVGNKPGKKWYYAFSNGHTILPTKHAEYVNKVRGVTEQKMKNWFSEVLALLETDSEVLKFPERVFNMDDTCFFLAPKGGLIIGPRGQHVYNESTNSDKENITTLFAVNAKGQFAPPLTLYKQVETSNNVDIEEVKHHLHYFEGHIEPAILAQFKEAKAKDCD
ncbi:hypothetical protein JTB14_016372 [Gonioctena quinquepunctata]|nr:hypothetical protein JTB14_016372 [Gonioctena quinquepunctata]